MTDTWQLLAECRGMDPELFWGGLSERERRRIRLGRAA
jgi:hypothetical protein